MAAITGSTGDPHVPGVKGENTNTTVEAGVGVHGVSKGAGVLGESGTWHGVAGISDSTTGGSGVHGESRGVGAGVGGVSANWVGVYGESNGTENGPAAIWADGKSGAFGVKGHAKHPTAAGVAGFHLADGGDPCVGVLGNSKHGHGVRGEGTVGVSGIGQQWIGVYGETHAPMESGSAGVWGDGLGTGDGVKGVAHAPVRAAVSAFHLGGGAAIFAQGSPAARFDGNVEVTGDVILQGADYAEALTTTDPSVAAGLVVVLGEDGEVHPCGKDYDTTVAGVVSGAGGVKPALVLDRHDSSAHVALMGKVWCHADADAGAIRPGDLLTTSSTTGHCRRVTEPARAFGAVIGKALTALPAGRGLIRVLVSPR